MDGRSGTLAEPRCGVVSQAKRNMSKGLVVGMSEVAGHESSRTACVLCQASLGTHHRRVGSGGSCWWVWALSFLTSPTAFSASRPFKGCEHRAPRDQTGHAWSVRLGMPTVGHGVISFEREREREREVSLIMQHFVIAALLSLRVERGGLKLCYLTSWVRLRQLALRFSLERERSWGKSTAHLVFSWLDPTRPSTSPLFSMSDKWLSAVAAFQDRGATEGLTSSLRIKKRLALPWVPISSCEHMLSSSARIHHRVRAAYCSLRRRKVSGCICVQYRQCNK